MVFRMNLLSIYILRSISYNKTLYEATGDVTVAPGNFHFFFFQSCLFCSILSLLINIHNFGKYSNHFDLFRDIQIDITEFTLGHFIFETHFSEERGIETGGILTLLCPNLYTLNKSKCLHALMKS